VSAARDTVPPGEGSTERWWKVWRWRIWADPWGRLYGICAVAMAATALVLRGGDSIGLYSGWVDDHATFLVEAVLIFLIGVFWVIQTIDRKDQGAPKY
jgi:hypothetical protein